ncbi:MAG: M23 family metallopeptidase [Cyanobacteria bacterium P01_A01_bin.84]
MTQPKHSAQKNPHKSRQQSQSTKRLASMLPAQSLCWLGSFSILSSGLVLAQTDPVSPVDNLVPRLSSSTTSVVANKVEKDVVIKVSAAPAPEKKQPELSKGRVPLRQRLKNARKSRRQGLASTPKVRKKVSPSVGARKTRGKKKVANSSAGVRTLRNKLQSRRKAPVILRQQKPLAKPGSSRSIVIKKKPQVKPKAVMRSRPAIKAAPAPETLKKSPRVNPTATSKPKDYNNAYIDPTNYEKKANRVKYKAPSSVVIKNRTGGCKAVLSRGQQVSNPCRKQRVAKNSANNSRKPKPSWIRKSQNSRLTKISASNSTGITARSSRPVATSSSRVTNTKNLRRTRVNSSIARRKSSRLKSVPSSIVSAVKSQLGSNRFIPSPENFAPNARTKTNSTAIAPKGGILSAPITAANIAPRPSLADYNIPLASVLPRINFNPVYAHGGTGLNFPLSVPATITSLFGWRQHPITGNQRFHSGVDIGAAMGTPVVAAYDGKVEIADWAGGYGLTVILNHSNSQQTLYGHMSQVLVRPGQFVEKGTVVGRVGSTGNSTGPHLHFEVRQLTASGWVAVNPGAELQLSLNELIQSNQSAQVYQPEG